MENKSNTGFVVMLIIAVVIIIGLTGYIVYDKVLDGNGDNVTVKQSESDSKENVEKQVDADKLGRELFKKYTDLVFMADTGIFSSQDTNYNNLDNTLKLQMALKNSQNVVTNSNFKFEDVYSYTSNEDGAFTQENYLSVSFDDFEKSYKELFGQDKDVNFEKFYDTYIINPTETTLLACYKESGDVVCYLFEGENLGHSYSFDYDYSEYTNNKLYVYVNYLGLNEGGNLCSDIACNNLIDDTEYDYVDDFVNTNNLFTKYEGKTGVYKVVFSKDVNDNWIWEETQVVKE